MGATITRANFERSGDDRTAGQPLASLGERFPAIERSRLLLDDDWDGAFRKGLGFLLDGIAAGDAPGLEWQPKVAVRLDDEAKSANSPASTALQASSINC